MHKLDADLRVPLGRSTNIGKVYHTGFLSAPVERLIHSRELGGVPGVVEAVVHDLSEQVLPQVHHS